MRRRGGVRFRWVSVARSEDAAECMMFWYLHGLSASWALLHSRAS